MDICIFPTHCISELNAIQLNRILKLIMYFQSLVFQTLIQFFFLWKINFINQGKGGEKSAVDNNNSCFGNPEERKHSKRNS